MFILIKFFFFSNIIVLGKRFIFRCFSGRKRRRPVLSFLVDFEKEEPYSTIRRFRWTFLAFWPIKMMKMPNLFPVRRRVRKLNILGARTSNLSRMINLIQVQIKKNFYINGFDIFLIWHLILLSPCLFYYTTEL